MVHVPYPLTVNGPFEFKSHTVLPLTAGDIFNFLLFTEGVIVGVGVGVGVLEDGVGVGVIEDGVGVGVIDVLVTVGVGVGVEEVLVTVGVGVGVLEDGVGVGVAGVLVTVGVIVAVSIGVGDGVSGCNSCISVHPTFKVSSCFFIYALPSSVPTKSPTNPKTLVFGLL
jgi:hypothetical protein